MRRIRSTSGGCVASSAENAGTPALKNRWHASSACGLLIRDPCARPPIFLSAPPIPSGLRVNCTAEASARNSRCREMAALISRPKKTPAQPITSRRQAEQEEGEPGIVLRVAVVRRAATVRAVARQAHHDLADQGDQQDAVQHAHHAEVQPHVAVEDMAELVARPRLAARRASGTPGSPG